MKVIPRLLLGLSFTAGIYGLFKSAPLFFSASEPVSTQNKCLAISDVSHRPLGELEFSGAIDKINENGFTDYFLHDRDNKIKVGLREQWGASVIFFGQDDGTRGVNGSNTLDASALGRGVQTAFHEDTRAFQGCAYNESCLNKISLCPDAPELVGWNPTQAGNKCGVGAGVEVISPSPNLSATVTAKQFNPGWRLKE